MTENPEIVVFVRTSNASGFFVQPDHGGGEVATGKASHARNHVVSVICGCPLAATHFHFPALQNSASSCHDTLRAARPSWLDGGSFMNKIAVTIASFGALMSITVTGAASAQSRNMSTVWMIQPSAETPPEQVIGYDGWVLKQALLPEGLFRLDGDAKVPGRPPLFPKNAQLIEVRTDGAIVACDAIARRQKLLGANQYCLIDYDRDGSFDGMFAVQNISKGGGMPTVQGRYPTKAKPIEPVAYSRLNPTEIATQYFVGIRNAGKAAIYDRQNFQICYGSEAATNCLTDWSYTSASVFPATMELLGAKFTVLSRDEGQVKLRVDRTMPPQPFGIISTTTYTIR